MTWMHEGFPRKLGLNVYHPSEWKYSLGFELVFKNKKFKFRYAPQKYKFHYGWETRCPT